MTCGLRPQLPSFWEYATSEGLGHLYDVSLNAKDIALDDIICGRVDLGTEVGPDEFDYHASCLFYHEEILYPKDYVP